MTRRHFMIGLAAGIVAGQAKAFAAASAATGRDTIAIIGTGHVAGAVAKILVTRGYPIVFGSRDPGAEKVKALLADVGHGARAVLGREAVGKASVIILAVPGRAATEAAAALGDLTGKVVVDMTNDMTVENGYTVPKDGPSRAELIQAQAPKAKVVKALNTLNIVVMADPKLGGDHVTCPVAGNDKDANAKVVEIIKSMGLDALDVGPLVGARYLEAMARMNIGFRLYQPGLDTDFSIHVRGTPRAKL